MRNFLVLIYFIARFLARLRGGFYGGFWHDFKNTKSKKIYKRSKSKNPKKAQNLKKHKNLQNPFAQKAKRREWHGQDKCVCITAMDRI